MYLGYFATQLGFLLSSFSAQNLLLYLIAWMFQLLRIVEEERFLSLDPAYRAYQSKVRYRLFPGLV
jgi:protein-S-isoprenylcysteine O-methyltransferase Ste14